MLDFSLYFPNYLIYKQFLKKKGSKPIEKSILKNMLKKPNDIHTSMQTCVYFLVRLY